MRQHLPFFDRLHRRELLAGIAPSLWLVGCAGSHPAPPPASRAGRATLSAAAAPSFANTWLDIALEATAREVDRTGPRPTILARTLAITLTAMYDAWAAYDERAVGTRLGPSLRRPPAERTEERKRAAVSFAVARALCNVYPKDTAYVHAELRRLGYDPANESVDLSTPEGIGNVVAREIVAYRRDDGANQYGDDPRGRPEAYADTTGYLPVNPLDRIVDPDRWQPIAFDDGRGGKVTPGYLTPQWARVRPFALERGDRFRPGPPPKVGSKELFAQADEVMKINADLDCGRKALVEFMRDGPRSTGQAGHWLRFAQMVSRRNGNGFDTDVKLYFLVANVALDAFIAAWDTKLAYDSSRPWTLIHHYFAGRTIRGWGGPDKGAVAMQGEAWKPYSPSTFITPPFPGYVSGHSCVSAACADALRLFTGSDRFGAIETRACGALTETPGHTHRLELPTFTETAELAGISRIYGGYHTRADNVEGLRLGRNVTRATWPTYRTYFDGKR